jgi:hypothetical protein
VEFIDLGVSCVLEKNTNIFRGTKHSGKGYEDGAIEIIKLLDFCIQLKL